MSILYFLLKDHVVFQVYSADGKYHIITLLLVCLSTVNGFPYLHTIEYNS